MRTPLDVIDPEWIMMLMMAMAVMMDVSCVDDVSRHLYGCCYTKPVTVRGLLCLDPLLVSDGLSIPSTSSPTPPCIYFSFLPELSVFFPCLICLFEME